MTIRLLALAAAGFAGGLALSTAARAAGACECAVGKVSLRVATTSSGVDPTPWRGHFVLSSQGTLMDEDFLLHMELVPERAP